MLSDINIKVYLFLIIFDNLNERKFDIYLLKTEG